MPRTSYSKKNSKKNKIGSRNSRFGFGYEQPSNYYKLIVTYNPGSLNEYRADYVPMDFKRPPLIRRRLFKWDPRIDSTPGYRVALTNIRAPNGNTYLGFNDRRNGLIPRAGAPRLHSLKLLNVQKDDDWGLTFSNEIDPTDPEHPLSEGYMNHDMAVLNVVNGSNGLFHGASTYEQNTGSIFTFGRRRRGGAKSHKAVMADIKYLSGR
jgi:hypothetical protein